MRIKSFFDCLKLYLSIKLKQQCYFANGTKVGPSNLWLPDYGESICAHQNFRSCSDIKIVKNTKANTPPYRANPVQPLKHYPQVFSCSVWDDDVFAHQEQNGAPHKLHLNPNKRPDPFQFTGAGIRCFLSPELKGDCNECRKNCMSPDKKCSDYCFCRRYL